MKHIQKIFQIAISNKPVCSEKWSGKLKMNMHSFNLCYPEADYYLYQDAELREMIVSHFDSEVLMAYDKLKPFAFKADLARYCLLYIHGGLYSDLSYLHINPIRLDKNIGMVIFRDIAFIHPSWAVSNAIIYSDPGRKEFSRAVEMIVANAANRVYGEHPLDVTGPYLFGRAVTKVNCYKDVVFGDSKELVEGIRGPGNLVKMLPNQGLIALRNKEYGAQMIDHGFAGTNNYAAMWNSKEVWSNDGAMAFVRSIPQRLLNKIKK